MEHRPSLPVEILFDIFKYLNPATTIIGDDAAWNGSQRCWWDNKRTTKTSAVSEVDEQDTPVSEDLSAPEGIIASGAGHPYEDLLVLRQVSREFDEICSSFLYHDFNLVDPLLCDEEIASEVIRRYHGHIRTVRISLQQSWTHAAKQLTAHLSECVTSLGVYYQRETPGEEGWADFNSLLFNALGSGRIASLGIYSTTTFSIFLQSRPHRGATDLLKSTLETKGTMARLTSLDIVLDAIDAVNYDAIRSQLGNLHSLTIRGGLGRRLGQMWEIEQQGKWFPSHNLTKLQLIHCSCAYALHIPHVAKLFPALKTLFIAGCGITDDIIPPRREKGWSVSQSALWERQAPLDIIRLECMAAWEVAAIGAIHTENLIITALDGGTIADAFEDKEIYPCLKLLRTELQYKELPPIPPEGADDEIETPGSGLGPIMEQVCRERGIVITYDVEALMFPR